jgi:hypothetical protein
MCNLKSCCQSRLIQDSAAAEEITSIVLTNFPWHGNAVTVQWLVMINDKSRVYIANPSGYKCQHQIQLSIPISKKKYQNGRPCRGVPWMGGRMEMFTCLWSMGFGAVCSLVQAMWVVVLNSRCRVSSHVKCNVTFFAGKQVVVVWLYCCNTVLGLCKLV